ncbi:MAG: NAD(P)-dependent oxidoreductase [Candidatus Palauibacterales bacterium]|nr:NAD(P)-dependent oxidoreductase [Candidatus Palauibacterales bacterium]MDP2529167.1 NAD(P)-dependent oxidoreductase [Candidatus Palauibacterales bacterium]MDP2583963.1 NAD(P)-dependent oxidoreductase [Candidatus Palauibacterales bacterium]
MRIAFLGLGRMGLPMASNLLAAGHDVVVYNRTRSRAEPLESEGARVAGSPAEAAEDVELLVTMLADDAAVEHTVLGASGALATLPEGSIHLSMSTISTALSRRLGREHAAAGQAYVAAPVFGRPEAAASAELWVLAAGAPEAIDRARPVMEALGQGVIELGEEPETANLVKVAGNFLLSSMLEGLAEAFALVRKNGVDPELFLEIVNGRLFRSPIYEGYGGLIARGSYEPAGFALKLGLKDTRLVLAAADESEVPMPAASVVRDRYLTGMARGLGELDWSGLGRIAAEDAGLDGQAEDRRGHAAPLRE